MPALFHRRGKDRPVVPPSAASGDPKEAEELAAKVALPEDAGYKLKTHIGGSSLIAYIL